MSEPLEHLEDNTLQIPIPDVLTIDVSSSEVVSHTT
jgi:hypothetical protein